MLGCALSPPQSACGLWGFPLLRPYVCILFIYLLSQKSWSSPLWSLHFCHSSSLSLAALPRPSLLLNLRIIPNKKKQKKKSVLRHRPNCPLVLRTYYQAIFLSGRDCQLIRYHFDLVSSLLGRINTTLFRNQRIAKICHFWAKRVYIFRRLYYVGSFQSSTHVSGHWRSKLTAFDELINTFILRLITRIIFKL